LGEPAPKPAVAMIFSVALSQTPTYIATLRVRVSGAASAVKEPGYFEVRKSSSQVTRMHFFSSKKLTTFFCSRRRQNTGRQRRFTVKIKPIKRSDMVTFLFSAQ